MNNIDMIHVIIHEYAHAFSNLISKGYVNAVVEEAFADMFAEMSINNYIQKGNKINYIPQNDNEILAKNNGYYEQTSYIKEGEFTRSIMYTLKTKDRDLEALREYLFGEKERFVDICEEILGGRVRTILTEDLANVQNWLGVKNNTELYLPQATRGVKKILDDYFDYFIDKDTISQHIKSGQGSQLYTVEGTLMDAVCFENKVRYEWLKKIDFSRISRSNAHEIFSNLTVEDIQEICTKSNGKIKEICSQWGYSDFIKVLIKGWYLVNKENPSGFEEIFALTGGMPYDVFLEILKDEKIDNINDVLHLLAQYHVLEDKENYENILDLLNKKVGNEFYKEQYKKQKQDKNESMLFFNENVLEVLSKLNCTNEDLQKILYIYSNPLSKIGSEHVWDIIDILEKIDYSVLSENDLNNLFGLEIGLADCITYQMYNKKRDLGLLIKIQKLPRVIMERIEYCMVIDNLDILDDVGEAIDTLKKYGYIVENKNEILDCIQSSKYRDIKVVPSLNSAALYAFMAENNKTKILLSTCINQFLEDDNPDFFKEEENINTCLMLLDFSNQMLLDMSDETIKRICSIMQRKLATSNEISSGDREILENGIKRNIKRLENRKSLSKLSNFFYSGPEEDYELCISIHDYFLKQELTEQQANDIITFFKCEGFGAEDTNPEFFEHSLENINSILEMFKNTDISIESSTYDVGEFLMIYRLMRAVKNVSINDENIETLREIYRKLRTIKGLDENNIVDNLFGSEEIKNRICNNSGLKENGVTATFGTTRTSQINDQVSQIIEKQKGNENVIEQY